MIQPKIGIISMLPAQQETQHRRQIANTAIFFVGRVMRLVPNVTVNVAADNELSTRFRRNPPLAFNRLGVRPAWA